jgi:hypothetical protein
MSFMNGPSLDMTDDNVPALTFVKPPEVQEISQNRDIPKSMNIAPQNDPENIKSIQDYLNSDDMINLIGKKYNGPIDGKLNDELINTAKLLELTISKSINKNIDGLVLKTTANDLKKTVKLILAYKNIYEQKQLKISQDQRIYELGKIKMIKK